MSADQKPKLVLGRPPVKEKTFEEWKAWMNRIYIQLTGKTEGIGDEITDAQWQEYWEIYKKKRGWD